MEEKQKSEYDSSKPTTAKKVIIKTNNKDERTHIDFPLITNESKKGGLPDSKAQTKSMMGSGDDVYNKNDKTISEEENENNKYLEGKNRKSQMGPYP